MRSNLFLWGILAVLGVACLALVLHQGGAIAGIPDDKFASLAYVGVWGAVLASGLVILLRTRLAFALKSAIVWGLFFVVLVGAYAYAPEFQALKNRIYAVLVPGTLVAVDGSKGRQFMAVRGSDGHFHLNGTIDGEEAPMIVDTGASTVAMDAETARLIGIDPKALNYTQQVMTANGLARAAPVRLKTVKIGGIVRHNVSAAVTEGEGLGVVLLGMSFLDTLTSYDFRGNRLILTD
ncbi:TIGR02281 family clan AA aspartic protease [Jiella sp. M17.18]|uniref:retropepsin-like aspartic protease family protein n=1 Tax=Jiella sp. M17.18 TaxID=3234247 RepID=UPI0034E00F8B